MYDHSARSESIRYQAPTSLAGGVVLSQVLQPKASRKSKRLHTNSTGKPSHDDENCAICLCPLEDEPQLSIKACNHSFHGDCIKLSLTKEPRCPICRLVVGEPQGPSPSGTMSISLDDFSCSGYSEGTIIISYSMPSGVQQSYHEHPGSHYSGASREAYLPNNDDGQRLLTRLKYTWTHGLAFCVGTSLTTGATNTTTWSSVHHKTSPSGGVHGFPDPLYFANCNESLDALGVPDADSCLRRV